MQERIVAFIRLSRPKFLLESLLTVTLGLTVSVYSGQVFLAGPWLLVQLTVSATHLMTHYCNEYFDLEADSAHTAPTNWTGGSQVLVRGTLRPAASLSAAFLVLFAVLVLVMLMPTQVERFLALAGVVLAWFYTAPPIRLNYRAFGEFTTAAVLTILCPLLACYAQMKTVPPMLLAMCVPLLLVMAARMVVMNFCDRDSDLLAGKHTLPNTLGPRRAAIMFAAMQVLAYGIVVAATLGGTLPLPVGIGFLLTAPLAVPLAGRLLRDPPSAGDPVRAVAIARLATVHAAATGYVATLGMIITAVWFQGDSAGSADLDSSVSVVVAIFLAYTLLFGLAQLVSARGDTQASAVPAPASTDVERAGACFVDPDRDSRAEAVPGSTAEAPEDNQY
jgi:1,4-dihydroxy-2-naphthoate octaprenyltransferase